MKLEDYSAAQLQELREVLFHLPNAETRARLTTDVEAAIRAKRDRLRIVFMPADHAFVWWSFGPSDAVQTLRPYRELAGLRIAWDLWSHPPAWVPLHPCDYASSTNDCRNKLRAAEDWVREQGCEALAVEIGRIEVSKDAVIYRRDRRFSPVLDVGLAVIE